MQTVVAVAKSIGRAQRKSEQRAYDGDIYCQRADKAVPKKTARTVYYKKSWRCDESCRVACKRA